MLTTLKRYYARREGDLAVSPRMAEKQKKEHNIFALPPPPSDSRVSRSPGKGYLTTGQESREGVALGYDTVKNPCSPLRYLRHATNLRIQGEREEVLLSYTIIHKIKCFPVTAHKNQPSLQDNV